MSAWSKLFAAKLPSSPLNRINQSLLLLLFILGLGGSLVGGVVALHDSRLLRARIEEKLVGAKFPATLSYRGYSRDKYSFVEFTDEDSLRDWLQAQSPLCQVAPCFLYSAEGPWKEFGGNALPIGADKQEFSSAADAKAEGFLRVDINVSRWGDSDYGRYPWQLTGLHLLWWLPFLIWRGGVAWLRWVIKK